jgi:hypothetical protein
VGLRCGALEGGCSMRARHLMLRASVAEFVTTFAAEGNRLIAGMTAEAKNAARELREAARHSTSLAESIADGIRTSSVRQKLDDLQARRIALEATLANPVAPPAVLHPKPCCGPPSKPGRPLGGAARPG